MVNGRTIIKKPFLGGTTIRVKFRILDEDRNGFQPSTLTTSVYDLELTSGLPTTYRCLNPNLGEQVTSVIVNDQDGADVSGYVDSTGQVEVFLAPEDTEVSVPSRLQAIYLQRRIRFEWTWDSPEKVGAHEIFISLAPDRATAAA